MNELERLGKIKRMPMNKVFIKTPHTFMGPEGAPKIPQKFFTDRHPPSKKADNSSLRVKEFLLNKSKFKNPLLENTEPDVLDFLKLKMEERELPSYKEKEKAYSDMKKMYVGVGPDPKTPKIARKLKKIGFTHPASFTESIFRPELPGPPVNLCDHPVEVKKLLT